MTPDADWVANLESFLTDTNGELSRALKVSALIVLAAEELRACVEQKALFFFGLSEDSIMPKINEPLPAELKGLTAKQQAPRLEAASRWFQNVGAFDQEDVDLVRLAMDFRNSVAHELQARLIKADTTFFVPEVPFAMVLLAHKVNLWWMKNFEFDCEEWSEADFENAEQLSTSLVRHMILAAFPELAKVQHEE